MTDYSDLSEDAQIEIMRAVAATAAASYDLEPVPLELVTHAYNTTFAMARGTERVAMRIGTGSTSGIDDVVAQHAFVRHLAAAGVSVPDPLLTVTGAEGVLVPCGPMGRDVLVTAARWLEGPDLEELDPADAHQLGRTMARMHQASEAFVMPSGGQLPELVEPLFGESDTLSQLTDLSAADAAVLTEAMARCQAAFEQVMTGARLIPCHADLHGNNLKRSADGSIAVFDFDDVGLTLPVLDLAISAFYLSAGTEMENLMAGYAEIRELPIAVTEADFSALVASRQLLLANEMLTTTTASMRAEGANYLAKSVDRLRRWLETGEFSISPVNAPQ